MRRFVTPSRATELSTTGKHLEQILTRGRLKKVKISQNLALKIMNNRLVSLQLNNYFGFHFIFDKFIHRWSTAPELEAMALGPYPVGLANLWKKIFNVSKLWNLPTLSWSRHPNGAEWKILKSGIRCLQDFTHQVLWISEYL